MHTLIFARLNKLRGQMLLEMILVIGLCSLILPGLFVAFQASVEAKPQQERNVKATQIIKETERAVINIEKNNWTNFQALSELGALHPVVSGSSWATASGSLTINGLVQQFIVSDVNRDINGNIVSVGGSNDPSTKLVTVSVSWTKPQISLVTEKFYLTRTTNIAYTDSATTDFNKGTSTSSDIVATTPSATPNDGQIQLTSNGGGGGDWCKPGTSVAAIYDLPGQGVMQEISATTSASIDAAYVTSGGNASGDAVDGVNISHASPPIVSNPSLNNEAKAYGIYVDNANSYVYFNENNPPNHTVRIVQTNNLAGVGYFDVNNGTGNGVFVSGNVGYTIVGSKLYSFDVSVKTGSRPQFGFVNLAGNGTRVVVYGGNAYVSTSSTTNQLQIINVTDPSHMSVTKSINLGNNLGGVDVFVDPKQTYGYVVTSYSAGKNDFYIVDLANTTNKWGYMSINGMNPTGVTVVSDNKAILVGTGGELYEVFDITTPSAVTHCGGMSPAGVTTIFGVSSVIQSNGNSFSYILTDNSSAEFQAIQGGPGFKYASSGIYESATYDSGYETAYNRFVATASQSAQTEIKMQMSVASAINNSCTGINYTYVGPDGTNATYFTPSGNTISGVIPLKTYPSSYQNPGRCFRYKTWLSTTDLKQTPILFDMSVNYSP